MNSERNQLLAIAGVMGLIVVCAVMFLFVGGDFLGFGSLHVDGILSRFLWAVPIILLAFQQLYVIPKYLQGYWAIFAEDDPTFSDLYIPVVNENKIFPSESMGKTIIILWVVTAGLLIYNALPFIGIEFLSQIMGSILGAQGLNTFAFYMMFFCIIFILVISFIRGLQYMSVRADIYDLHNKYLGERGTGLISIFYRVLYFIPIGRSLALLIDLQILDKLTKFNEVENMGVELREDK